MLVVRQPMGSKMTNDENKRQRELLDAIEAVLVHVMSERSNLVRARVQELREDLGKGRGKKPSRKQRTEDDE